jgi:hypothetical protein
MPGAASDLPISAALGTPPGLHLFNCTPALLAAASACIRRVSAMSPLASSALISLLNWSMKRLCSEWNLLWTAVSPTFSFTWPSLAMKCASSSSLSSKPAARALPTVVSVSGLRGGAEVVDRRDAVCHVIDESNVDMDGVRGTQDL